jgi:anhydro-N-acetylmuramic acid kinase
MENNFLAIGLMSGTSLDGLDICYVKFEKKQHWNFEILHAETIKYPKFWEEKLKNAFIFLQKKLLNSTANMVFISGKK